METKPMGSVSSGIGGSGSIRECETLPEPTSPIGRVGERVKHATNDVMLKVKDFGQKIPQNVTEAGRALDVHVHQHPRVDIAIVGSAGLLLGALFGRRVLRFGMLATGAFLVARMYPQIEQYLRAKIEAW